MLFRKIIYYAFLVGMLTGLVVTLAQSIQVVPIIQGAEVFEGQGATTMAGDHHDAHSHDEEWAIDDGFERTFYTLLANSFIAAGFSMLLLSVMLISKDKFSVAFNWKEALAWSSAGYLIFFLAPSIGMPPEIPLSVSAPIEDRQSWWLLTVLSSAIGLAGLAFAKAPWRWMAPALIFLPYLVGTPHLEGPMFGDHAHAAELEQLAQNFIFATAFVNALLWLMLGVACTWVAKKIMSH